MILDDLVLDGGAIGQLHAAPCFAPCGAAALCQVVGICGGRPSGAEQCGAVADSCPCGWCSMHNAKTTDKAERECRFIFVFMFFTSLSFIYVLYILIYINKRKRDA